eukprot:GEMP01136555.1.p1 GENE.GEMP01136555.1~~GEMP01136555.1.p1  ORF type:complete len:110 (-),score=2.86 GEMP01136555.1:159-449(-)
MYLWTNGVSKSRRTNMHYTPVYFVIERKRDDNLASLYDVPQDLNTAPTLFPVDEKTMGLKNNEATKTLKATFRVQNVHWHLGIKNVCVCICFANFV